jgi:hypothetical protein
MRKIETDVKGSKAQILDSHGIELYRTDEVIKTTFSGGRPVYLLRKGEVEVKLYGAPRLWITVCKSFDLDIPELRDKFSHHE